jgi:cytochrome oxidase Cu insertion factor (SCO1/SenC/PrrC family)
VARRAHVDYDIAHSDVIVLVGPDGRIRRVDQDADMIAPATLLEQVRELLPGAG